MKALVLGSTIVPAFLEQIESNLKQVPHSLVQKTSDLPYIAKDILESKAVKSTMVSFLLEDIAGMPEIKHLRASFDATILNFMGE